MVDGTGGEPGAWRDHRQPPAAEEPWPAYGTGGALDWPATPEAPPTTGAPDAAAEPEAPPPPPVAERAAGPFPTSSRVLFGILGAGLLAFFALNALGLYESGYPITAAATLPLVAPFALFLLLVAAAPSPAQRALGRVSRVDLRRSSHASALALITLAFFMVFGMGILNGVFAFELAVVQDAGEDLFQPIGPWDLAGRLATNAVLFILPPFVWVGVVFGVGPFRSARRLGLRSEGAVSAAGLGVAFTFASILALAVASLALTQGNVETAENEQARAIIESVNVAGAFALAVVSGFTEEVFFRGFLMPRVGMWAQAVLFSLAHLSYLHVGEVVVTFLLALGFGWLYKRTGNLWAPIAAHFSFNLIMLLVGLYAGEA